MYKEDKLSYYVIKNLKLADARKNMLANAKKNMLYVDRIIKQIFNDLNFDGHLNFNGPCGLRHFHLQFDQNQTNL